MKVRDPSGHVVARGRRRYTPSPGPSIYGVAFPGEQVPLGGPLTVEVSLRSNGRDTARLAATAEGAVNVGTVRPSDDGLRLVYADAGATIYRRLTALRRIRWASHSGHHP